MNTVERALRCGQLESAIAVLEFALGLEDTTAEMKSYLSWPEDNIDKRRETLKTWFADVLNTTDQLA